MLQEACRSVLTAAWAVCTENQGLVPLGRRLASVVPCAPGASSPWLLCEAMFHDSH